MERQFFYVPFHDEEHLDDTISRGLWAEAAAAEQAERKKKRGSKHEPLPDEDQFQDTAGWRILLAALNSVSNHILPFGWRILFSSFIHVLLRSMSLLSVACMPPPKYSLEYFR